MTAEVGARTATATAPINIALVKYWGKRDEALRLPQNGSISLSLADLHAETRVEFGAVADRLVLDGEERGGRELLRVSRFLDEVRERAGIDSRACVTSVSTVPVAAGLASSACGFAALALAAASAAGLDLDRRELSRLARLGSGSACRSVYGGLVEWRRGERDDGADSYAEQLLAAEAWPLAMAVAIIEAGPKETGSTEGMARSTGAPGYRHWLATVEADLEEARRAIRERDLDRLGLVAESNATKMHLAAATANPPIVYWTGATASCVRAITAWRHRDGVQSYFTVDAGPNVVALCRPDDLAEVSRRLEGQPGVTRVIACRASSGPHVVRAS